METYIEKIEKIIDWCANLSDDKKSIQLWESSLERNDIDDIVIVKKIINLINSDLSLIEYEVSDLIDMVNKN